MATKKQKSATLGGAVIIDDGQPLHPHPKGARGRSRLTSFGLDANFKADGIMNGKCHVLTGLLTNSLVVRYRGAEVEFPWGTVKSFRVESKKDYIVGELKDTELRLKVNDKFRETKPNYVYYAPAGGTITKIKISFVDGGKYEIEEKQDFDGGVTLNFDEGLNYVSRKC